MTGESGSIEPHLGRCATSADHGELVGGNRESNAVQVRVGHCMKLPSAVRATLAAAAVCGGALPGGTFRPDGWTHFVPLKSDSSRKRARRRMGMYFHSDPISSDPSSVRAPQRTSRTRPTSAEPEAAVRVDARRFDGGSA